MKRVIAVGDVITDVLAVLTAPLAPGSDASAAIRMTGGGQAANTAAWLSWSGVPVTLVAAVGTDEAGNTRLSELAAGGVHCTVRRWADTPTGSIVVLVDGSERTMITDRGASLRIDPGDIDAALAAAPDAGHLHLSAYTLLDAASQPAGRHALAVARGHGLTTSVDAASAAPLARVGRAAFLTWVRGVDLLLANGDEAAVLTGAASATAQAEALARWARVAAVVKRGVAGAVWAGVDGPTVEASTPVAAMVDPTGAGDAFAAGLLAAWLSGAGPAEALAEGVRLGALAVTQVGARPVR
ncbi:MAG TPA: PfkB family carbohydrate kinase [Pilimelia sp.]|nr:PfkB family carbohydrate kinase [Pilimelia sp.]